MIVEARRAELDRNPKVRGILLATGESDEPPEWCYNEIWMQIRGALQAQ
jgi:hypothetical protein